MFTDGGCRNNEGEHVLPTDKAAWAYVILHDGHAMTATGGKVGATNNQMEMTAVLESLKALEDMGLSQKKLLLSLDSDYVRKALSDSSNGTAWIKGWKERGWRKSNGEAVANPDLWKEIDKEFSKFSDLTLQHVTGHANSDGNNLADALVKDGQDVTILFFYQQHPSRADHSVKRDAFLFLCFLKKSRPRS
ncbi:ribonuclease H family protein [Lactobacillus delbrueckii subsp. bulgaricus]